MKTSEIIQRIYDLLNSPKAWTQGFLARVSLSGLPTFVMHDKATCWCLWGALEKVIYESFNCNHDYSKTPGFLVKAIRENYYKDRDLSLYDDISLTTLVEEFNDDHRRTHQEILDVCLKAKVFAEQTGD